MAPCDAFMDKILDAGFWILDFKGSHPYFIPAKDGIFDLNLKKLSHFRRDAI